MTPEQKRIAIAEACGWELIEDHPDFMPYWEDPKGNMVADSFYGHRFPDYLNDLNAMHEAVITLPEKKRIVYGMYLYSACGNFDKNNVGLWHISTATAHHRAEAFLKTLDLWKP